MEVELRASFCVFICVLYEIGLGGILVGQTCAAEKTH